MAAIQRAAETSSWLPLGLGYLQLAFERLQHNLRGAPLARRIVAQFLDPRIHNWIVLVRRTLTLVDPDATVPATKPATA